MQELIDVIRAAIATDASVEQKAAGVQACRTIDTALGTEPGKPLAVASAAPVQAMSRISFDQILDLMIARLGVIATEREESESSPALPATASATKPAALRVAMATGDALKIARRAAAARPVANGLAPRRASNARAVPTIPTPRPVANARPMLGRKP